MLTIEINLDPFGDSSNRKRLAKIAIANVGREETGFSRYVYLVYEPKPLGGLPPICFRGKIEQYDRIAPVVDLLSAVMQDYAKRQDDRTYTPYEIQVLNSFEDILRTGS